MRVPLNNFLLIMAMTVLVPAVTFPFGAFILWLVFLPVPFVAAALSAYHPNPMPSTGRFVLQLVAISGIGMAHISLTDFHPLAVVGGLAVVIGAIISASVRYARKESPPNRGVDFALAIGLIDIIPLGVFVMAS